MFNSTPADTSCFWSNLGILEPFAFSVFLFCHPFEGRDSLKKREIHEEPVFLVFRGIEMHSGLINKDSTPQSCPWF